MRKGQAMAKKEKRFVIKEEQSLSWGSVQIVVDTATGVNYLTTMSMSGVSGITPLLDAKGYVVVDDTAQNTAE